MEEAYASKCDNSSQVCCRKDTYFNAPFDDQSEPMNPSETRRGKDKHRDCGVRNLSPNIRIAGVHGTRLQPEFGEWPNMCIILNLLEFDGRKEEYYKCGASLISPNIVLTAAHCVA